MDVPDDLTDEQAALAYINPLTAGLMVDALSPMPGERIGITAAGSTIGLMLIRMLARVKLSGHGSTVEFVEERHEPVGAEVEAIG